MSMGKKRRNLGMGGYHSGVIDPAGEYECSGSSGRMETEVWSAPKRKCTSNVADYNLNFGVRKLVLPVSSMLSSERKDLISKLRTELEQIQVIKKRFEMHRRNGVTESSSSDIIGCRNGMYAENLPKSSAALFSRQRGSHHPVAQKTHTLNHGTASSATVLLMKQCSTVLRRLMTHKLGKSFLVPVDIVALDIPDYFTFVKHPMDLGTIQKKITKGIYSSPLDFAADVRLTFTNAMNYNPRHNPVHVAADDLCKKFEIWWKPIEKKIQKEEPIAETPRCEDMEPSKPILPSRKRPVTPVQQIVKPPDPAKRVMSEKDRITLGRDLESLNPDEIPSVILNILREHSSSEDGIEISIDDFSDETMFTLRKLLDEHAQGKVKSHVMAEPCSMELLNSSGLSNSSMQPCDGNDIDDEDVDIGGDEPPVTSYPPVEIEKESSSSESDSSSSESDSDDDSKASSPVLQHSHSEAQADEKTTVGNPLEGTQSGSGLDQVEETYQPKPSSVESVSRQDGDNVPTERPVYPDKQHRAALLKHRFADTILRAQAKTFDQGNKGDPEKLRRQREELELQQKREKARLQAEAKVAEEARRKKEAEALAEAKRKRELEREAARQALQLMEKTVEINDSHLLQDVEMQILSDPMMQFPVKVDETLSLDHSADDGLGGFEFHNGNKPLERLGLFMIQDQYDDEEEQEAAATNPVAPNPADDTEEGEIDIE